MKNITPEEAAARRELIAQAVVSVETPIVTGIAAAIWSATQGQIHEQCFQLIANLVPRFFALGRQQTEPSFW